MTFLDDTKRETRILNAITMGVKKEDFTFKSEKEKDYWDELAVEVGEILDSGMTVWIPSDI